MLYLLTILLWSVYDFVTWLSSYTEAAATLVSLVAGITVVLALIEKLAEKEFVGRRVFRLIGRILKFFVKWFLTPFQPYIAACQNFINHSERLEQRFIEITEHDATREEKRDEQFGELKTSIGGLSEDVGSIKKEVTLNGGQSMKDAVVRLLRHDSEKWDVMQELRDFVRLTNLRLDIADEADKRMTFRLAPDGSCTMISAIFLRFFGYTEKDIIGTDWDFCIGKQSAADVSLKWKKAFQKHTHYRNDQFIVDSDLKEHYCRVNGYPMSSDGEFQGFYGTVEVLDQEFPGS